MQYSSPQRYTSFTIHTNCHTDTYLHKGSTPIVQEAELLPCEIHTPGHAGKPHHVTYSSNGINKAASSSSKTDVHKQEMYD